MLHTNGYMEDKCEDVNESRSPFAPTAATAAAIATNNNGSRMDSDSKSDRGISTTQPVHAQAFNLDKYIELVAAGAVAAAAPTRWMQSRFLSTRSSPWIRAHTWALHPAYTLSKNGLCWPARLSSIGTLSVWNSKMPSPLHAIQLNIIIFLIVLALKLIYSYFICNPNIPHVALDQIQMLAFICAICACALSLNVTAYTRDRVPKSPLFASTILVVATPRCPPSTYQTV